MIITKKKIKQVVFIVVLLSIWTWFAFNTDNADYSTYATWYGYTQNNGLQSRFEFGFDLLMLICVKFGLGYNGFLMVISSIGLVLVGVTIKKYCRFPIVALLLYFMYPYFFDIVQIRNFIAMAIVFWGIRFLETFNKKNVICYISTVIISMMFHVTTVFCFLYMFAYLRSYKKIMRYTLISILAFLTFYLIAPQSILNIILNFGNAVYLDDGSTLAKVLGYSLFAIVANIFVYIQYVNKESSQSYDFVVENNSFIAKLIPIMLFTCVVIFFSSQGYRMFRNMSLILYVVFLNSGPEINGHFLEKNTTKFINWIFVFSFAFFFFMRQLSWKAPLYDTVTKMIFENNAFWK